MALTDEQKRLRAEAYGASEVATLVRAGWKRLIELYEAKVQPRFDDDDTLASELGTLEEEPVARVYARRTGSHLARVASLRHPTKLLAIATPDRARFNFGPPRAPTMIETLEQLEDAERLVEVKTHAARFRRDYGNEGTGQIPEHEAIQVTWQMGVTGVRLADVPVLFRGDWGVKLETFTVGFNEELFEHLYEAVERFHVDHVLARKPPPPDGSDEYSDVMGRLHSVVRKAHLSADETDEDLMMRYAKFVEVEKRAKRYKEIVAQALMQRIGDAGGLLSTTIGKLSWIAVRDTSQVDWKKAANDALMLGGLVLDGLKRMREEEAVASPESLAELERRLKAILPDATKPRSGYRYLKLYPKGDAQLELVRLNVAMDALEPGE